MVLIIIGIVAVIILSFLAWFVSTSNGFKASKIKIAEAKSGIEVALIKRYDMLTKLLDVAKGYAKHEKELMIEVVYLRKGMTVGEMTQAENQMDQMATQLRVTAEVYPELRSSEVFMQVQVGIRDAEEHLQAARRLYNSNVTILNTMIEVFPSSIIGKKYEKEIFFQGEENKKLDVQMKF